MISLSFRIFGIIYVVKIVISSSIKNRELIQEVMEILTNLGYSPLFPNLEEQDYSGEEGWKKRLALEHYEAIENADAMYVLTPGGYMGTSCTLELGYALAKNKPVFFSHATGDDALDCYVKKIVPISDISANSFNLSQL